MALGNGGVFCTWWLLNLFETGNVTEVSWSNSGYMSICMTLWWRQTGGFSITALATGRGKTFPFLSDTGWELAAPRPLLWAGKDVQLSDRSDVPTEWQLSPDATCCHTTRGSQFEMSHFVSWVKLYGLFGSRGPVLLAVLSHWVKSSLWALRAGRSSAAAPALSWVLLWQVKWHCFIDRRGTGYGKRLEKVIQCATRDLFCPAKERPVLANPS